MKILITGGASFIGSHVGEYYASKGDFRHCFTDVSNSKIENNLGYKPKIDFERGMKELVEWGEKEEALDKFEEAHEELLKRKLVENGLSHDYPQNIRKIKEFMRGVEIDIIERFAEFKYLNMDECIGGAIKYLQKFEMSRIKKSQSREKKGQEIKS